MHLVIFHYSTAIDVHAPAKRLISTISIHSEGLEDDEIYSSTDRVLYKIKCLRFVLFFFLSFCRTPLPHGTSTANHIFTFEVAVAG